MCDSVRAARDGSADRDGAVVPLSTGTSAPEAQWPSMKLVRTDDRNGKKLSAKAWDCWPGTSWSSTWVKPLLDGHVRPPPRLTPFETWWQPAQDWVVARVRMSAGVSLDPRAASFRLGSAAVRLVLPLAAES